MQSIRSCVSQYRVARHSRFHERFQEETLTLPLGSRFETKRLAGYEPTGLPPCRTFNSAVDERLKLEPKKKLWRSWRRSWLANRDLEGI